MNWIEIESLVTSCHQHHALAYPNPSVVRQNCDEVTTLSKKINNLDNRMILICKTLSLFHPRIVSANCDLNWPNDFREEDFSTWVVYFCCFVIISPWRMTWLFIWTNWNLLHPKVLCANFWSPWQQWPSGSEEEIKQVKSLHTYRRKDRHADAG